MQRSAGFKSPAGALCASGRMGAALGMADRTRVYDAGQPLRTADDGGEGSGRCCQQ